MGIRHQAYAKQMRSWAQHTPWSVVRAWHRSAPVGVSIMLPLSAAAYEDVYQGRLTPYDCTARHLDQPSLNLGIEAVAERPSLVGRENPNPTLSMRVATLFQLASLARCNRLESAAKLRILSFAGTPENARRLKIIGFGPT